MKKNFALIKIDPPTFIKYVDNAGSCRPGYKIVPCLHSTAPSYNKESQKISENVTVTADDLTIGWTITQLPSSSPMAKSNKYSSGILEGFKVPGKNIVLGLQDKDRSSFTSHIVLINELLGAGIKNLNDIVEIGDKNGKLHQITIAEYKQIILQYGAYYESLWKSSK